MNLVELFLFSYIYFTNIENVLDVFFFLFSRIFLFESCDNILNSHTIQMLGLELKTLNVETTAPNHYISWSFAK